MPPRNAGRNPVGRTYAYGETALPGVTTIINRVIAKPALVAWAAERVAVGAVDRRNIWRNMARDEAVDFLKRSPWRERERAADRGTLVHLLCEVLERDEVPEIPQGYEGFVRAFNQWRSDFAPTFRHSETTVVTPPRYGATGYAGRLDFIAQLQGGDVALVDIKIGKDVYPETSLQLTAYRQAELIVNDDGSEEAMPFVDSTWALRLMPDDYDFAPVRSDASVRVAWEAVLDLYSWAMRSDLIGQGVGPHSARRLFA
jgi:hypothetical protein